MTCSKGQQQALNQLEILETEKGSALKIYGVEIPREAGETLLVDVKIRCGQYERAKGGLPLREKEHFCLSIPTGFPFEKPSVDVPHIRFSGFPHVQWRRHLCLYQAPDTEWNPSDGMYGFLQRLDSWLIHGALNQLDPIGEPLHPPAIYPSSSKRIVPRINTPAVNTGTWFGFANLKPASELRFDIDKWYDLLDKEKPANVAPVILLDNPFPFEYPSTVRDTIKILEDAGVNQSTLMLVLQMGVAHTEEGEPMYIVIGTPMRGVGGDEVTRKQHLAVWEIEAETVAQLKLIVRSEALLESINKENLSDAQLLAEEIRKGFDDWTSKALTRWCRVMEARSEIVERRDGSSDMNWFAGKSVSIWGCGALGGHVAESVARAGAKKVVLRDNNVVTPGVLQRQNFVDHNIGYTKCSALCVRLLSISPELEVVHHHEDIVANVLNKDDWFDGTDIVIDATASNIVSAKLESVWSDSPTKVTIISMAINATSDCGLLTICSSIHSGGPYDVFRRTGLSVKNREHLLAFADQFWPQEGGQQLFQPEPGCSDPTFRGSYSDVTALAAEMVNQAAKDLQEDKKVWSARGHIMPTGQNYPPKQSFSYRPDQVIDIPDLDIDVRITETAWRDINGWISRSARVNGSNIETGGLLFGELDEAVNVLWVNEVLGPPPDSCATETLFECGIEGTQRANKEKMKRSRGSTVYVGTWHTHPVSAPEPSQTDYSGLVQLLAEQGTQTARQLLLIAGYTSQQTEIGAYIFDARSIRLGSNIELATIQQHGQSRILEKPREVTSTLGLTLSGGGSRAIAFHLGCLRALRDLGLLSELKVISSVSGGSVMAAMYAYNNDEFGQIEKRVLSLLKKGLVKSITAKLLFSPIFYQVLVTQILSGSAAFFTGVTRFLLAMIARIFGIRRVRHPDWIDRLRPPFRRWKSVTSALEAALEDVIGSYKLSECSRQNMDVVFNACEMRTGTAFRFSNKGSHSWRYGWVKGNDITVAHAVSASAAFPVFLPAHDDYYSFERNSGEETRDARTIITDGGVYENLGITAIEPGRDPRYNLKLIEPDIIICCDAGAGQFGDHVFPYGWGSRMTRALDATFRKVQDGLKARLHSYTKNGDLKAFIYAYLGQIDSSLPFVPAGLVARENVAGYPTDFSAMEDEDIVLLADRGEMLTRYLITRYFPDD